MSDLNYSPAPAPSGGLKIPILFGAVIVLLGANIYLFLQLDNTRKELGKFREATEVEIANLQEASKMTSAANQRHIQTLKDELEAARRQATMAVGQAKTEALNRAETLTKRLADEQRAQAQQMASQISAVQQDTTAKFSAVNTDVTGVKTEVASTKSQLEKTIADLKRVNGDMGVMSGLIATNGKELSALKALGDRNYFEFNLKKEKRPQKVGDVAVQLKKADAKRNRYTIELVADDKKVEKKDKGLNEPVQFYVAKARQPYEIVVNEIRKNQIIGYLATPKVQLAR